MKEIYNRFLNAYWLRPETAIWRTLDVLAMKQFHFLSPSLDLGCGDGTFSFLRADGEYKESFDVFLDIDYLDQFFEKVDVYDSFKNPRGGKSQIKKSPDYLIDVGLDHKKNLISKAAQLGLYHDFVEADANQKLPFQNESFQTVFSNIIYWLDNPLEVFKEIYRVLRKNGTCCIMLPNTTYLESSFYYSFYKKEGKEEFKFLELIDRGRMQDNLKIVKSYQDWKEIIEKAGLEIEDCIPHLSKTVIQIWDIGLRPIFPMLKKMTQYIEKDVLLEIKKEWIQLFQKIGEPIIENDRLLTQGEEFCFFCFILRKK